MARSAARSQAPRPPDGRGRLQVGGALAKLEDGIAANDSASIGKLRDFIDEVERRRVTVRGGRSGAVQRKPVTLRFERNAKA